MAISRRDLIWQIEKIAPPALAEEWDNAGPQIDVGSGDVKRVLVALDVTDALIREAKAINADYIVAHHPLIFHAIRAIDGKQAQGRRIADLIRAGISLYAAHTSFDAAYGGNNDHLAALLGLQKIRRFQARREAPGREPIGRIGDLRPEARLAEVCRLLKEKLGLAHALPAVGDPECLVGKVGLCTGGGGDLIEDALRNGCSLFITGDIRHHEALLAAENGLCLIDAGHFATEWIFVKNFAEKLKSAAGDVLEVVESRAGRDPFVYL
jgi:dinuclear metal center YbgI/SA1388 family protein